MAACLTNARESLRTVVTSKHDAHLWRRRTAMRAIQRVTGVATEVCEDSSLSGGQFDFEKSPGGAKAYQQDGDEMFNLPMGDAAIPTKHDMHQAIAQTAATSSEL